jgi:hypothetical protein
MATSFSDLRELRGLFGFSIRTNCGRRGPGLAKASAWRSAEWPGNWANVLRSRPRTQGVALHNYADQTTGKEVDVGLEPDEGAVDWLDRVFVGILLPDLAAQDLVQNNRRNFSLIVNFNFSLALHLPPEHEIIADDFENALAFEICSPSSGCD